MPSDCQYISKDGWLAGVLGRDVYRISIPEAAPPAAIDAVARHIRELQSGRVFMYAKLAPTHMAAVGRLETLGFHLIDTNVVFAKPISRETVGRAIAPADGNLGGVLARSAVSEDRKQTVELARRSFGCSRFHLDPEIPKALADEIKARWVDSFFAGHRGDSMVVASHGEAVVGFCLLLHGMDGSLTIDLIAVDATHRGRGIAGGMIAFAEPRRAGFTEIRVGTQIANTASIRCYEKVGFRQQAAQYVFHYHHPPGGVK